VAARTSSQADSLAAGLRASGPPTDARAPILVAPVDMRPLHARTMRTLLDALSDDVLAVTPVFQGRGGHPVVVRASALAAWASAPGSPPPLRELLAQLGSQRLRVEVDDALVLEDLDEPAQLSAPARFAAAS
jgi:CTP:molybdopterin cytidylyltransferase MocA